MKKFRDNGVAGALLDEYEKSILELKDLLQTVTHEEFLTVADSETEDPDCRSIQTVLTHTVQAGYGYNTFIKWHMGEGGERRLGEELPNIAAYQEALDKVFQESEAIFEAYPQMKLEEHDPQKKILTRWGQLYDPEQLMEHAVMHILRHRRQIERFLVKLRGEG